MLLLLLLLLLNRFSHVWLCVIPQKASPFSLVKSHNSRADTFMKHEFFSFCFLFTFCSYFILVFCFTIMYWFCHTLTWICLGCTCVPHPECPSHVPPHPIPLGHPSAPTPSTLYQALDLDGWFVTHRIICMFQCHSPKSFHPYPLPESKRLFYTSVSLLLSHIQDYHYNLSKFHICISILYWHFSFWLTSLCIIGSSFIHLTRTHSNVFFLMAE